MLKKTAATLALAAALPLAATTTAAAKDVAGRFGLGAQSEAGGASGLNLRYWLSHFGLQATVGAAYTGGDASTFGLDLSVRGLFNFARANDTNLYAGAGLSLGLIDHDSTVVDLLLGVEHFFTDHFSVGGQVGLHVDVGADPTVMTLGTGASWGSAFHFYF